MVQFSVREKNEIPNKGDNTSFLEHSWKVFEYDILPAAANKGGNFRKRAQLQFPREQTLNCPLQCHNKDICEWQNSQMSRNQNSVALQEYDLEINSRQQE